MKLLTENDRINILENENKMLTRSLEKTNANLAYLAMMLGIDLTQMEDSSNEPKKQTGN